MKDTFNPFKSEEELRMTECIINNNISHQSFKDSLSKTTKTIGERESTERTTYSLSKDNKRTYTRSPREYAIILHRQYTKFTNYTIGPSITFILGRSD